MGSQFYLYIYNYLSSDCLCMQSQRYLQSWASYFSLRLRRHCVLFTDASRVIALFLNIFHASSLFLVTRQRQRVKKCVCHVIKIKIINLFQHQNRRTALSTPPSTLLLSVNLYPSTGNNLTHRGGEPPPLLVIKFIEPTNRLQPKCPGSSRLPICKTEGEMEMGDRETKRQGDGRQEEAVSQVDRSQVDR